MFSQLTTSPKPIPRSNKEVGQDQKASRRLTFCLLPERSWSKVRLCKPMGQHFNSCDRLNSDQVFQRSALCCLFISLDKHVSKELEFAKATQVNSHPSCPSFLRKFQCIPGLTRGSSWGQPSLCPSVLSG